MKFNRNENLLLELDSVAMSRSESDQDNYLILDIINHGTPVIQFAGCESFEQAPFNLCHTEEDKRRMMASILTMGTARRITKFSAENVARNIDLVMNLYKYMKEMDKSVIEEDPFLQKISLPMIYGNTFVFSFHTYQANRLFHFSSPVEEKYRDILQLGYFRENVNYPYITKNGQYYASISAHEIMSAKKLIAPLKGNVLISGVGVGYLPYLAHLKNAVKSITVVEEDKEALEMFAKEILPQFDHPEKIHIQNGNIYEILKQWEMDWDYVLLDHYTDSMQGVFAYLDVKPFEEKHKKTKFLYQIEGSILSNIKSALLIMCMAESSDDRENLYHALVENEEGAEIIHRLQGILENYTVSSVKDLQKLFKNTELKKILRQ